MISLQLRVHQEFDIEGVRYRFAKELSSDRALFVRDDTGAERVLAERELEDLLAVGKFRTLGEFKDRKGRRTTQDDSEQAGPDVSADPMARSRAFYVRLWDKNPTKLSSKKLDEFVARHAAAAEARGIVWHPSSSALRRALGRGAPGHRPMQLMQSRTGRAKGSSPFPGFNVRLIDRAVAYYYERRQRTVTDAYAWLRQAFVVANRLGPKRYPDFEPLVPPVYETLRVKIEQAECRDTWARKYSVKEARRKFVGVGEGLAAAQILETVLIDSTRDDVFLGMFLIDGKRMLPLGRPTVTLAVDVHSRMPTAVILTFEPMSLYTVMAALMETNTPKHRWREVDPRLTRDCDAWGRPSTIIVDNAWEQTGVSFQDACEDVGTSVEWAPVKNPEYKAIVERLVHTMQTLVTHKMDGAVTIPVNLLRKLELNPEKDFCVDIDEFRLLLRRAFVHNYQMEVHTTLGKAPAKAWAESKDKHGRPFVRDATFLAAVFGKTDDATLTREGIRYRNLRFHDQQTTSTLLDQLAHSTPHRGRRTGSATAGVKIKYDPADCRKLQVWNHAIKRYVELPNVDVTYVQEDSLSWAQHDLIVKYARANNLAFYSDDEKWAARNALRAEIERFAPRIKKLADMRQVRRVLNPPAPHADFVAFGHLQPSIGGLGPKDVEIVPAALDRADEGLPQPGARRGGAKKRGRRKVDGGGRLARAKPPELLPPPTAVEPAASDLGEGGTATWSTWSRPSRSPAESAPDWVRGERTFYDD